MVKVLPGKDGIRMRNRNNSLFLKAKKGNIEAFEKLIEPYERRVFGAALKMVGDRGEASKLAQEVFVRLFSSISGIEDQSLLSIHICRTVKSVSVDVLSNRILCENVVK